MGLADFLVAGQPQSYITDLDPEFAGALDRFVNAVPGVSIYSGARSNERQAQLWEQALKKYGSPEAARKWVAPPGRSMHNKGGAADLRYASDAARTMAHERAQEFGLTFPMGHEPWHIEPIGARGGPSPEATATVASAPDGAAGAGVTPTLTPAAFLRSRMGLDENPMVNQSRDLFAGHYGGDDLARDMLQGTNPLRRAFMSRLGGMLEGLI